VEDLEDDEDHHIFAMDDINHFGDVQQTDLSDSESGSILCISSDQKSMISKLDSVMELILEFISGKYRKGVEINDPTEFSEIFYGLLDSFEKTMLPTHKLKCCQFLIFHACSLANEHYSEDFMGLLMTKLMNSGDSNVIRMASASYLASFVARVKFVKINAVRHCLGLLNTICQQYMDTFEEDIKSSIEVERFGVFYATVQAILYIFCFRWKQILHDDKIQSGHFPLELNGFQRVLLSKFAPLKVCADPIVEEFSKITLQLNLMYCYSISGGKSDVLKSESASQTIRLDTFFPFDPLPLPKAKNRIDQYQEWDGEDLDEDSELASLPAMSSDLGTSFQGMSLDEKLSMSLSLG
jgi:RNA polymerase I-specific transcription initiation factor RRN3